MVVPYIFVRDGYAQAAQVSYHLGKWAKWAMLLTLLILLSQMSVVSKMSVHGCSRCSYICSVNT